MSNLVAGAIPTSKSDVGQLLQLNKLLDEDEKGLVVVVPLQEEFLVRGHRATCQATVRPVQTNHRNRLEPPRITHKFG